MVQPSSLRFVPLSCASICFCPALLQQRGELSALYGNQLRGLEQALARMKEERIDARFRNPTEVAVNSRRSARRPHRSAPAALRASLTDGSRTLPRRGEGCPTVGRTIGAP